MQLNFFEGLSQEELDTPVKKFAIPVETAFNRDLTVEDMLAALQGKKISHEVRYFYATDHQERLIGTVGTRDLLFSQSQTKLSEISTKDVIYIMQDEPLEQALRLMTQHELLAIPITDKDKKLCGIFEIHPTKAFPQPQAKQKKQIKELFQLVGLSVELNKLTSSFQEFSYRMPWLLCNLLAGLICAFIGQLHRELLDQFVIIAIFIPLVLTLGESVSMQSMALSLQFLQYEKIPWNRVFKRIWLEWKTAVLLGSACGLLVAVVYFFWDSNYQPLLVITSSIVISMLAVTTFGSLLPIILHSLKLDPKVAAGPVVLMLTDMVVTIIYLFLASFFLI